MQNKYFIFNNKDLIVKKTKKKIKCFNAIFYKKIALLQLDYDKYNIIDKHGLFNFNEDYNYIYKYGNFFVCINYDKVKRKNISDLYDDKINLLVSGFNDIYFTQCKKNKYAAIEINGRYKYFNLNKKRFIFDKSYTLPCKYGTFLNNISAVAVVFNKLLYLHLPTGKKVFIDDIYERYLEDCSIVKIKEKVYFIDKKFNFFEFNGLDEFKHKSLNDYVFDFDYSDKIEKRVYYVYEKQELEYPIAKFKLKKNKIIYTKYESK